MMVFAPTRRTSVDLLGSRRESITSSFTTSSSATPSLPSISQKPTTGAAKQNDKKREFPHDLIRRIGYIIYNDHVLPSPTGNKASGSGTLRSLQTLSKDVYEIITPILYLRCTINQPSPPIFSSGTIPTGQTLEQAVAATKEKGIYFDKTRATVRRLDAIRHIKHLIIFTLPGESFSDAIAQSASPRQMMSGPWNQKGQSSSTQPAQEGKLKALPSLDSVTFTSEAIDSLREWSPETVEKVQYPFLTFLAYSSAPSNLCISFRVVLSQEWERGRLESTEGQYGLTKRLNLLASSPRWKGSLKYFDVHDITHQVLPCAREKINTYYFTPHSKSLTANQSSSSLSTAKVSFPRGLDAVDIPGPQWNLRSWQIAETVKSLFPSSATAATPGGPMEILGNGTIWKFVGVENHILTKKVRDDNDEITGAVWNEVKELIKGNVMTGLTQDLPARHGFKADMIPEVLERLGYLDEDEVGGCPACGRKPLDDPPLRPIVDTIADKVLDGIERALRRLPIDHSLPEFSMLGATAHRVGR